MNVKILGLLTSALVAVCTLIVCPAAFSSPVTYDYTGVIIAALSVDFSIPVGSQVTGTYTFDYANGNPAQSSGTIGSANWIVASKGGPGTGFPVPTSLVYSFTAQVGSFSYSNHVPPETELSAQTVVQGYANSGGPGSTFVTQEGNLNGDSSLFISNPHGAYSSNGLPILAGAAKDDASGTIQVFSGTNLVFDLTSLTLVSAPEIDSASAAGGLTLLLSGLAMAMGARRSRTPERSAA
jgi:hypothetical protein